MTTSDIEQSARRILQDTQTPYRWESTEMRDHLVDAVRHLNAIRPETRYVNGALTDGVTVPASASDTIALEDRFREALAYYVAYRCYQDDSSDTVNQQLAETYLAKANSYMQL